MSATITELTSPHRVTDDERASFEANGYVKLSQVLPREQLDHYGPLITEQVIKHNRQHLPMAERTTYGKAFLQVENLWRHDPTVAQFVLSRDLGRMAADLLGVAGVRLYHDQALYKEPNSGITPWHADQYYWPLASDRCCTVWIPLQDTSMAMGPLTFLAGSHRCEEGRDEPISDESERRISETMVARGFEVDSAPYALGDLSFHLGWTFHGAGANQADEPRRAMTMIYVDADMVVSEPDNPMREQDLRLWLPGLAAGDVVDSPLNPVVHDSRHP